MLPTGYLVTLSELGQRLIECEARIVRAEQRALQHQSFGSVMRRHGFRCREAEGPAAATRLALACLHEQRARLLATIRETVNQGEVEARA